MKLKSKTLFLIIIFGLITIHFYGYIKCVYLFNMTIYEGEKTLKHKNDENYKDYDKYFVYESKLNKHLIVYGNECIDYLINKLKVFPTNRLEWEVKTSSLAFELLLNMAKKIYIKNKYI
jgi:hypothetical protein